MFTLTDVETKPLEKKRYFPFFYILQKYKMALKDLSFSKYCFLMNVTYNEMINSVNVACIKYHHPHSRYIICQIF